jgi:subtilisin family serine protease
MKKSGSIGALLLATLLGCSTSGGNRAVRPKAEGKYSKALLAAMERWPLRSQKAWVFFTDKNETGTTETSNLSDLQKLDRPISPEYRQEIERRGAKVRATSRWLNAVSVEASPEVLTGLGDLSYVERVERVSGAKRVDPPGPEPGSAMEASPDLSYGMSYNQLSALRIPELHRKGLSGRGVTIALLDSGFRKDHEVFRTTRLAGERDFVFGDDRVSQDFSDGRDYDDNHGTAVWSVIGGFKPGELIGPAYGADYLLAKTEDLRGETRQEEDFWVAGLEWAKERGARIVSSSLGYLSFEDGSRHDYAELDGKTLVTSRAANIAAAFGILLVNAMGNEGVDPEGRIRPGSLVSPADAFGVLAVGAIDEEGRVADFSSRGPTADGRVKPDVVAPGVGIWIATSERSDTYDCGDETSFAAPLVAGLAALLWEAHPEWTVETLRNALRTTSSRGGDPDNESGHGIVNAVAAIAYPAPGPPLASAPKR